MHCTGPQPIQTLASVHMTLLTERERCMYVCVCLLWEMRARLLWAAGIALIQYGKKLFQHRVRHDRHYWCIIIKDMDSLPQGVVDHAGPAKAMALAV